ncbi:hypothetical protein CCHR01_04393 [Colletotrichum chrysophilum]|uniref:Uncharacterized protein n=1 Tax=Colletotrichum chrysophilum TaxID=1836956 RepID=A0AAD9ELQ2_9PEZI|nr:hypothetical protein CCHR01_04393 [Colletotrichum chrysophilum]
MGRDELEQDSIMVGTLNFALLCVVNQHLGYQKTIRWCSMDEKPIPGVQQDEGTSGSARYRCWPRKGNPPFSQLLSFKAVASDNYTSFGSSKSVSEYGPDVVKGFQRRPGLPK